MIVPKELLIASFRCTLEQIILQRGIPDRAWHFFYRIIVQSIIVSVVIKHVRIQVIFRVDVHFQTILSDSLDKIGKDKAYNWCEYLTNISTDLFRLKSKIFQKKCLELVRLLLYSCLFAFLLVFKKAARLALFFHKTSLKLIKIYYK